MTDIEDKRTPVIGVTLKSSVDLAEASYNAGWRAALLAVTMLLESYRGPEADLVRRANALPITPSESIAKMRASLK